MKPRPLHSFFGSPPPDDEPAQAFYSRVINWPHPLGGAWLTLVVASLWTIVKSDSVGRHDCTPSKPWITATAGN